MGETITNTSRHASSWAGHTVIAQARMKAREMSAVLIVIKKRETPFGSGVEFSLLTQLTASYKKPFTIPGECLSNFLINFNGIRTSLGKSTTQTPGDFRGPLSCIQFNKGYSTILFFFPKNPPSQKEAVDSVLWQARNITWTYAHNQFIWEKM